MRSALLLTKQKGMAWLFACFAGLLVLSGIISCGKANTAIPVGANIQFQVVNLGPDLRPINLWVGFIKRNIAYSYPTPSGYFSMASVDTPLQIRSALANVSTTNFVSIDTLLRGNTKYTLFVTGLRADTSITGIFTTDTSSTSTPGRGKIRFVNASPRSPGLDVIANGTTAFTNRAYKSVSKFIEMAPGSYEFKISPAGSPLNVLKTLPQVSIQDGKLYTIYSYGIAGRVDSAAFGAGVIANR
ncbi:DUF4397 domain-containing protein [Mucilaginibacter calamicampi]|uniref:DUF4397 domain-containing protein n=1 Tax=Mucilaginibacter calamicampi TaxID=1302352 RepID=A0ABW2YZU0_9SPHI